jgi:MoaA/NifB/PqqE/SkfB family radical SAM enzyme
MIAMLGIKRSSDGMLINMVICPAKQDPDQPSSCCWMMQMIYDYKDITTVHLEITAKCNASCPMCGRNKFGGPYNEFLPLTELSLADLQTIMPVDFVKRLKRLYMCGNYGDPIVADDTLEVMAWLRDVNPEIRLGMHTNGSARNTSWWSKLGSILNGKWDYVKFGIDGLADTNHVYRRGTIWQKIMENAAVFISNGGQAHWEYIVFKHNEHQVDQAEQMANSLGFAQFRTKKTGRFFSNTQLTGKDKQEVWNRNGVVEYHIEKPLDMRWHNDSLQNEQQLIERFGSMQTYLDSTYVRCKVAEEKSVYISAEGLVFPCCWTANQLYVWYWPHRKSEMWALLDDDTDNVNALKIPLETIINGKYFNKIADSWSQPSISDGKLRICAKTCGSGFDQFADQFTIKDNTSS